MEKPSIGIVIPCFNESGNLPRLVDECRKVSEMSEIDFLIVDNGSTDITQRILKDLLPQSGISSIRIEKNIGLASALVYFTDACNEIFHYEKNVLRFMLLKQKFQQFLLKIFIVTSVIRLKS